MVQPLPDTYSTYSSEKTNSVAVLFQLPWLPVVRLQTLQYIVQYVGHPLNRVSLCIGAEKSQTQDAGFLFKAVYLSAFTLCIQSQSK